MKILLLRHARHPLFNLLTFLAIATSSSMAIDASDTSATSEAQQRLLADLKFLASDELQGRSADTPGLKMAADYIANRWQDLGLKTDLFDGKPLPAPALPASR